MKKFLLSIGLIGLFTFYALEQRGQTNTQNTLSLTSQSPTSSGSLVAASATPTPTGPGIRIGQLVNINGTIYLVKADGLYGFPSMAVFNSYGYKLSDVTTANSAEIALNVSGVLPTQSAIASTTPTPTPAGKFKDGTYTGSVANAFYGNVQVQALVTGGKLTNVSMLEEPTDRGTSKQIASQAFPQLISEAIASQSSTVDIISGATQDSQAFQQSLYSALSQAI